MTRSIDDMIHDSRRAEEAMSEEKLYPDVDPSKLPTYCAHVAAMTAEGLDSKAAIAEQLAWRDAQLAEARAALEDGIKRRAAEGHAYRRRIANQKTELRQLGKQYRVTSDAANKLSRERDDLNEALGFVRGHSNSDLGGGVRALQSALSQAQQRIAELERAGSELNRWMRDNTVIGLNTTVDILLRAVLPDPPIPAVSQREERYDAGYAEGVRNEVALRLRCQEELSQAQRRIAELEAELCVAWSHDDAKYAELAATSPSPQIAQVSAEGWEPQLRDVVRFKDTTASSVWYTVRGVDTGDKTALLDCNDGIGGGGWHLWSELELTPEKKPSTTPSEGDPGGPDHMMRAVLLSGQGDTDGALTQVISYLQAREDDFTRRVAAVVAEMVRSRRHAGLAGFIERAEEMAK